MSNSRLRVLIVEDDADLMNLLRTILEREEYETAGTSKSIDALQQADSFEPHVIITDLAMPHMSGNELIERLRASPNTKFIPIVVCTSTPMRFADMDLYKISDAITKPISAHDLLDRLKRICSASSNLNAFFDCKHHWSNCGEASRFTTFIPQLLDPHTDGLCRQYIFEQLAFAQGDQFFTTLAALVHDPQGEIRRLVAVQLSRFPSDNSCELLLTLIHDVDSTVRREASRSLGLLQRVFVVQRLIDLLNDEDDDVCEHTLSALGEYHDTRIIIPLIKLLSHRSLKVRNGALQKLQEYNDKRLIQPFVDALFSEESSTRELAGEGLLKLRFPALYKPAIRLLKHNDSWMRKLGVQLLQNLRDRRALKPLIISLRDPDMGVRQAAAEALAAFNSPEIAMSLMALLDDKSNTDNVRQTALKALGDSVGNQTANVPLEVQRDTDERPGKESVEDIQQSVALLLIHLLGDENVIIRGEAIIGLAKHHHASKQFLRDTPAQDVFWRNVYHSLGSIDAHEAPKRWGNMSELALALTQPIPEQNVSLRQMATNHANIDIRIAALKALGHNRDKESTDILIRAATASAEPKIMAAALEGLGMLGHEEAVDLAVRSTLHESTLVRYAAVNTLVAIGTPRASHALRKILGTSERSLQIDAIKAFGGPLSRIPHETAVDILAEIIDSEQNAEVLYSIALTFSRLKSEKSIPEIQKLLIHPSPHVQAAARMALELVENLHEEQRTN